ncbi:MAG TPA: hypothetical protein VGG74_04950 [Kofleriaceae bacterium]|jgi:hypothetical protein
MVDRIALPALGAATTLRLWLSYQRYALVLVAAPIVCAVLAIARAPWWLAAIVAVAAIVPVRFGVTVLVRWPRKLRATRVGLARIAAGTFTPASIRGYCSDPCFRVVARELLAAAGLPRAERRAIVQRFASELRAEDSVALLVDHIRGTVTIGGAGKAT